MVRSGERYQSVTVSLPQNSFAPGLNARHVSIPAARYYPIGQRRRFDEAKGCRPAKRVAWSDPDCVFGELEAGRRMRGCEGGQPVLRRADLPAGTRAEFGGLFRTGRALYEMRRGLY